MADVVVPRSYIDGYVGALHDLDQIGREALAEALARADLNDRGRVQAIMRVHCNASAEAAFELSTQFYRGMSILQTGVDPNLGNLTYVHDGTATDVATAAILSGDGDVVAGLLDRQSYEMNRASKVGAWRAGQADSREVRYARVPQGAETCAWCLMTAGLGFWFMTEESASHTHRGCDCAIVPSFEGRGDVVIEGYDSTALRDMWREANRMRIAGEIPEELQERIAEQAMRKGSKYRLDTNGTLAVMRWYYGLK